MVYSKDDLERIFYCARTEGSARAEREMENWIDAIRPGDRLLWGSYLLPNNSKPMDVKVRMPISWIVLEKRGRSLLLLSEYVLDWECFDGSAPVLASSPETSWAQSTLRQELNGEYLRDCFSERERQVILPTAVTTDSNPVYGTPGGETTEDCLFLLSCEQVRALFAPAAPARERQQGDVIVLDGRAAAEMLAAERLYPSDVIELDRCPYTWWLRTLGGCSDHVAIVDENGNIDLEGTGSSMDEVGVRPAMWVDMERLRSLLSGK